ncbi:zinc finger CCCH domain protein [Trifolium repens]|nr:zinc finger CCCH domain protein [Trifolium repens]
MHSDGQRWPALEGTDVYTYDSDLVAGYCRPTASPPPAAAIQEFHATIRVLPPKDWYISTLRNNVPSRVVVLQLAAVIEMNGVAL